MATPTRFDALPSVASLRGAAAVFQTTRVPGGAGGFSATVAGDGLGVWGRDNPSKKDQTDESV